MIHSGPVFFCSRLCLVWVSLLVGSFWNRPILMLFPSVHFLKNGPFSASFFFIFVFSIHWTVNVLYKFLPITADLWNWKRPLYQLNHNHCIFITNIWNHIWPSGWWWRPYAFKVQTSGAGNECSTNWAKVDASVTRYWAISNYENLHNAILWMMKEQNAWNEW